MKQQFSKTDEINQEYTPTSQHIIHRRAACCKRTRHLIYPVDKNKKSTFSPQRISSHETNYLRASLLHNTHQCLVSRDNAHCLLARHSFAGCNCRFCSLHSTAATNAAPRPLPSVESWKLTSSSGISCLVFSSIRRLNLEWETVNVEDEE